MKYKKKIVITAVLVSSFQTIEQQAPSTLHRLHGTLFSPPFVLLIQWINIKLFPQRVGFDLQFQVSGHFVDQDMLYIYLVCTL